MSADLPIVREAPAVPVDRLASVERIVSQGRTTELAVSRRTDAPTRPAVSVVVLNWNGGELLQAAVDSVPRTDDVEVLVVDNASTDGSIERLLSRTGVDVIASCPANLGYARGMNIGCRLARAPLVVLMNCDAALPAGYVDELIAAAARHPRAAMLGGPSYRRRDDDAHDLDAGPMELTYTMRVSDLDGIDRERVVLKVTGSCTALRLPLDPAITCSTDGVPFDESFVTYGEDIDLACRIWRAGHDTVYAPSLWSWHERSYASGRRIWQKRSELRRRVLSARYRNVLRHLAGWRRPLAVCLVMVGDLALVAFCLVRGDFGILRDVPQAAARGLTAGWRDHRADVADGFSVRPMPKLPWRARRRRVS